ncbi:MAG: DUF4381 family protein [Xanthomonadales bacterium]|nr:DUF4381 domain-containing protein [Xanthomonadales bacterium]NIX11554.1 DUF4381 family protein [Xanthomonadales bacterium]
MNPQGADLLAQLRDIHAAPAVPWWPPAPGWWVLAALVALGLFYLARHLQVRVRRSLRRRRLLRFVDLIESSIDPTAAPQEYLSTINRIFKLVAMRAFPASGCAQMQGAAWSAFLHEHLPLGDGDGDGQLGVLAEGPYQPAPDFDPAAMARLARLWVMQHG